MDDNVGRQTLIFVLGGSKELDMKPRKKRDPEAADQKGLYLNINSITG